MWVVTAAKWRQWNWRIKWLLGKCCAIWMEEDTCQWVVKVHNFDLSLLCILLPNYIFCVTLFRLGRGWGVKGGDICGIPCVCADHCSPYGCYFKVRWADLKFFLRGFRWAVGRLSSNGKVKERPGGFCMFIFLHFFCRLCFSLIEAVVVVGR